MSEMKNIFGVKATDSSLQSTSSGKFGLNTGHINEIVYKEEQKDGNDMKYIDIVVKIGDRDQRARFFLNTEVYHDNNLIGPGDDGYETAYFSHYAQIVAIIKHALGAVGVTEQTIEAATAGLDSSQLFEGMAKLASLFPADGATKKVDVFLEYQWSIPSGQTRTFLQLPKNMKGGACFVPHVAPVGVWKEVISDEGLKYVDDAGNIHPFIKNKGFMDSPKANLQDSQANSSSSSGNNPFSAASTEAPKASVWGK